MKVSIIVARSKNGLIGVNSKLPWHLPEDMKRFAQLTKGKAVIMGRKTWESLSKKPLPNRLNIVVSANIGDGSGYIARSSLASALRLARAHGLEEAFVIGGAGLYEEAIRLADNLYITEVDEVPHVAAGARTSYFSITPEELAVFGWQHQETTLLSGGTFVDYVRPRPKTVTKKVKVTIEKEVEITLPESFTSSEYIADWNRGLWPIDDADGIFKYAGEMAAHYGDHGGQFDGLGTLSQGPKEPWEGADVWFDVTYEETESEIIDA